MPEQVPIGSTTYLPTTTPAKEEERQRIRALILRYREEYNWFTMDVVQIEKLVREIVE